MRGSNLRRAAVSFLSVGTSALLVLGFLAYGSFGQGALAAASSNNESGTTHIGGNVNNNKTDSGTTVLNGHTVTTRRQSGQPTRVCVEHIANGKTNVENFDPFNPGNANQIVQELISSSNTNPVRVRGNETWRLCAAAIATTTTTTVIGTTTTTTTAGTTTTTAETTTTTAATTTTVAGTTETGTTTAAGTTAATTTTEAATTAPVTTVAPVVVAGTSATSPPLTTVEAASVAAAPTTTVAGVSLPRAGGFPLLPGALAGLGALLSLAGAALRRYAK